MRESLLIKVLMMVMSGLLFFLLPVNSTLAKELVEVDDDDFKTSIGNLAPGDSFKTGIDVNNVSNEDIEYVISLNRVKESEQQQEDGSKLFFENMQVVVTVDGEQRYEGSFAGVDEIDMGELGESENVPVTFDVLFPPESGNEYQGLSTTVSLKVDAAQGKGSDTKPPDDDDEHSDESENPEDTGNPPGQPDDPGDPDPGEPEQPGTPGDSPDDPAKPENPSEDPNQSDNPEEPQQPEEPGDDPNQPGDPDEDEPKPDDPEEPGDDETVTPGGNGDPPGFLPQTGENGNVLFYLLGTFGMAVGIYLYRNTLPVKTPFLLRYRRM
ncbi:LPXTG cell wall anchor domain-containing protein [Salibacterium salarium]|uniref:LPXTG cell wall anchor domain-containing protein n=1 Tax=Salibacterium salarium TaxID=284579 RepID=A0A3R9R9I9_9BACI|nr:LPXTG cell wall anchor domain-containing protein [Salibacterium salarium]RSL30303.1 LPXTG cell wall anchor domain-containing protein [Salibacterium salarium]